MTGLTGKIEFDSAGRRTNFLLNLVELREAGLVKTGEWSRRGLNVTTHPTEQREVKDQTVIVTTILVIQQHSKLSSIKTKHHACNLKLI